MSQTDPTERRLVLRAREGSRDACEELVRIHGERAWRAALAISGDRDFADDAVQEGFVRAFSALGSFDVSRPFGPWFHRITVNALLNRMRAERRLVGLDADALPADDAVGRVEDSRDLLEALRRLPVTQRSVLVLRYWLDLSAEEIAEELGVPVGTVYSRASRALERLRTDLGAVDVERP